MRKAVILFFLFIFVPGCGDRAPTDAKVTGPAASTGEVAGGQQIIFPGLDFTVTNSEGIALPKIEIEFFAGGTGILTDLNGNPRNPSSPGIAKRKTDDQGIGRVSYLFTAPPCPAHVAGTPTPDRITTGSVRGTVGSNAGHLWTVTITIKCS